MNRCQICGGYFPSREGAKTCSGVCRAKAQRKRQADAVELLQRQTRAIIDGAPREVLAGIARDADRLLGATR